MKKIGTVGIAILFLLFAAPGVQAQNPGCDPDTVPPNLICIDGLSLALVGNPAGFQLWATDFIALAEDNCTDRDSLDFRIGFGSGAPTPPLQSFVLVSQPGAYIATVWVIDQAGNSSSCTTAVIVEEEPQSLSRYIIGTVFNDENGNCIKDSGEETLEGWRVELNGQPGPAGLVFQDPFTYSWQDGSYSLAVPDYFISFNDSMELNLPLALNLNPVCPLSYWLTESDFAGSDTLYFDFPVQLASGCYSMSVDIAAPFLRRCFDSYYTVSFCNYGAEIAPAAYIDVTFDDYLAPLSSTLPWSSSGGQTFTFQLGDVPPGFCGSFKVYVQVSCEAELGQTHCTEAHIFPDQPCMAPYSGPEIVVGAQCDEEEGQVIFTITNAGDGPMPEALEYLVVEDVIMYMQAPFQLGSGESIDIPIPANGSTFRLEAEQVAGFPHLSQPSVTVEGCGQGPTGEVSLGFVTQFPQDEEAGFIAIDCQENIGAYDPNDKQAFPRGSGEEHFIRKNTSIDYKIRFQNTGTDTAFNIVVLDTLSSHLDVNTVRPGAASHPYDFKILGDNVLEFRFGNIMLPDSNVNLAASNGFVQFSVRQQPGNPDGTVIENSAAIYFDFNEPVITNTLAHTIGEAIVVGLEEPGMDVPGYIHLFPNPTTGSLTLKMDTLQEGQASFRLYHSTGQLALQQPLRSQAQELSIGHLPEGLYFFQVVRGQQVLSVGKVVVCR